MRSLAYKISHCLSTNHNPELCVICTGVTLFALVLHFLHRCYSFCTGVTLELHCCQPFRIEYFFFMCIIKLLSVMSLRIWRYRNPYYYHYPYCFRYRYHYPYYLLLLFNLELSHLEIVLLVLVAFMEFLQINEVVMLFF